MTIDIVFNFELAGMLEIGREFYKKGSAREKLRN